MENNQSQPISLFENSSAPIMDRDVRVRQLQEKLPSAEILNVADEMEPPSLYTVNGVEVLHPQTVNIVTAQRKSGKSSFGGLLMAASASPEHQVLNGSVRCTDGPVSILYIDTEMPLRDLRRLLRRAMKTAGHHYDDQWNEHNIRCLSLKDFDETERKLLIELAIQQYRPQLVVIDGIADLIQSINSEQESRQLMAMLDYFACQYNCCVVGMLHLNFGSAKIGGWTGTMASKKFTDSFTLKKDKTHGFFTVEHEGRGEPAPKMFFQVFTPLGDKIGWWQSLDQSMISELTDEDAEELSFRDLMDAAPLPCTNTALVSWVMQVKRWTSKSPANKLLRKCKDLKILNSRREGRQSIWFKVAAVEAQSQQMELLDDKCLCIPSPIYS